jgi:hypothetical protein
VDLMSIGEFARRSGLSANALRLYDELGLLPPARVDASSGYRFYAPGSARAGTPGRGAAPAPGPAGRHQGHPRPRAGGGRRADRRMLGNRGVSLRQKLLVNGHVTCIIRW